MFISHFQMENQLKDITIRLQDAQGDTVEGEREKKKKEAIENLMRVFPDKVSVFSRSGLCKSFTGFLVILNSF